MQGLKCQSLNVLVCFKSSFHMHRVVLMCECLHLNRNACTKYALLIYLDEG